jgi:hypothetical protein
MKKLGSGRLFFLVGFSLAAGGHFHRLLAGAVVEDYGQIFASINKSKFIAGGVAEQSLGETRLINQLKINDDNYLGFCQFQVLNQIQGASDNLTIICDKAFVSYLKKNSLWKWERIGSSMVSAILGTLPTF